MAWSTPRTWSVGEALSAANMNTYISDNLSYLHDTLLPTGVIVPYGGGSAPTGWLKCDGSAVSRTTYATLFALIGTTYGAGDGSTTFNLPDMRGRVPVGQNAATFGTLGGTGGEETHTLSAAEMPVHDHAVSGNTGTESNDHTHQVTTTDEITGYAAQDVANGATAQVNHVTTYGGITHTSSGRSAAHTHSFSVTSGNAGSGGSHNNLQPYLVVTYLIKSS